MFDFSDTLKKYEQPITIIEPGEGHWDEDSGQWVPGEDEEVEATAAVLPLSDEERLQGEGGTYTSDDRKMYYHGELSHGQKVVINDNEYTVDKEKDYSFHASGLRIYILVRKGESG